MPTGIDSMYANHTTSTTIQDSNGGAAEGGTTPGRAFMPLKQITNSPVYLTARSEASTQAEEVSSDIVRPTQASRGGEPCQSPSEGTKEQTDLLPGLHAKTCICLCCGLTSRCCIQPARPANTTYLHCIRAQTRLCLDCAVYVFASMELPKTPISTTSATGCETRAHVSPALSGQSRLQSLVEVGAQCQRWRGFSDL